MFVWIAQTPFQTNDYFVQASMEVMCAGWCSCVSNNDLICNTNNNTKNNVNCCHDWSSLIHHMGNRHAGAGSVILILTGILCLFIVPTTIFSVLLGSENSSYFLIFVFRYYATISLLGVSYLIGQHDIDTYSDTYIAQLRMWVTILALFVPFAVATLHKMKIVTDRPLSIDRNIIHCIKCNVFDQIKTIETFPDTSINFKYNDNKISNAIEQTCIEAVKTKQDGSIDVLNFWLVEKQDNVQCIDINLQNKFGKTAIMVAIENNDTSMAQFLFDLQFKHHLQGFIINPNLRDKKGNTMLLHATMANNTDIVDRILQSEFKNDNGEKIELNLNVKSNLGNTALLFAAKKNYVSIMEMLVNSNGIDLNTTDNHRVTPLMCSAERPTCNAMKLLLNGRENNENPIDLNLRDRSGNTALMLAVCSWNVRTTEYLVNTCEFGRYDIDFNIRDNNSKTALIRAISIGHADLVRALLSNTSVYCNLDLNAQDPISYDTPIIVAVTETIAIEAENKRKRHDYLKIIELLCNYEGNIRLDLNIQDDAGYTALMYAALALDLQIVKLLINTDINAVDTGINEVNDSIEMDEKKNRDDMGNEIDYGVVNNKGNTALMHACSSYSVRSKLHNREAFEIIKLLIKHDKNKSENANKRNNQNQSPLSLSRSKKLVNIIPLMQ